MNTYKFLYEKIRAFLKGESQPLAAKPRDFKLVDWKIALLATKDALAAKRIAILAAGIAYFATFAFFPLIAAGVAIASLVISHDQLEAIIGSVNGFLPADIAQLISVQLETAFNNQASSAIIAVVGVLIALFSISGAVINLISASNVSYEEKEERGFIALGLTSLGLMLAGAVGGMLIIGLLLMNAPPLEHLGVPAYIIPVISIVRWILIAIIIAITLAVFYRYGPDRSTPKWQWVSWGSCLATIIWMIGTALFFVYARYFANFSDSYSIFAGIIVLMTWFNLTSFIILLGAEINYRLETQTLRKTSK